MTNTCTTKPRWRPSLPRRRLAEIALAVLIVYAGSSSSAWAYIDPGSGGAIITLILGFFGAVAYTTRKYWYRLKSLFTVKGGNKGDERPR